MAAHCQTSRLSSLTASASCATLLASPGMTISGRCCRKGFGVRPEPADHRAVIREPATAVSCPYSLKALCARWRRTGPDVLNDLPTAVGLAFEHDDVAAFGSDLGAVVGGRRRLRRRTSGWLRAVWRVGLAPRLRGFWPGLRESRLGGGGGGKGRCEARGKGRNAMAARREQW